MTTATQDLVTAWRSFRDERAVALCATSLATDYRQVERWLERCPVQDLERGREAMAWVLSQHPPKSALRVGGYLKCFYRWASSEDVSLVARNPVLSFRFPKKPQSDEEITVIPQGEIPFVLAALERRNKRLPQWNLLARFMLQTGLRTGEARAVRHSDVIGDRLLVHQNFTLTHGLKNSTKTNKKRWVPLNPVAKEILEEVRSAEGFFFPWNRFSFQSFFYDRMGELSKQGLVTKRYRPYDLRHTAISHWLEAGVPVTQTASWAGNTAEMIWKHYANTTADYQMPII
jgi:integrase